MDSVNEIDKIHYKIIRKEVSLLIKEAALKLDKEELCILDIAPEIHKGAKEHFKNAKIITLDINSNNNPNIVGDICSYNHSIEDNLFDVIFCTEVLEHTENPFEAIKEIKRILKPGGFLYLTTPFNFRIHNPLPDNWRFTIHGLKQLLKSMIILKIEEINSDRFLMPIQYKVIATK
jgi:2-polyprenyl-3-methyl-5-hydroxy-6-metoxy-1,4-benzoquinol methylase